MTNIARVGVVLSFVLSVAALVGSQATQKRSGMRWTQENGAAVALESRIAALRGYLEDLKSSVVPMEENSIPDGCQQALEQLETMERDLIRMESAFASRDWPDNAASIVEEPTKAADRLVGEALDGYTATLLDQTRHIDQRLAAIRMLLRFHRGGESLGDTSRFEIMRLMISGDLSGNRLESLIDDISEIEDPAFVAYYLDLLESSSDPDIQVELIRALIKYRERSDVIAVLLSLTDSPFKDVAQEARNVVGLK